ncbi:efflux transporter periplasmic adaptor subunit [Alsobacter soli]|uniref:Efflux transporter periplasmic adaptor subunit n=1 Tax=Alsobacter soli TaxID=2109933 RepID=A0A2T1HPJ2_9HYPH|nr:efflux RND transporter periplasmic adaptor subunit [Alsobacter soli]PSC03570.1 efflux transporter periplasmic adaptor subunit [Alsobacter soli]
MRHGASGRVLACVLLAAVTSGHAQAQQAVPVTTAPAERKPVSQTAQFVGRIEAPERVEIRARVKGMLEAVLFKEGDRVAAGAPLYRIDKSEFAAAVEQAQGDLERAKASFTLAGLDRQRAETLLAKNAGSVQSRDQAVAQEAQARGAVITSQATLDKANINLGYTDIVSPIAGRIGRTAVTKGNIVGPDSGVLATIVSEDPMHVTFPVSQRDYLAAVQGGQAKGAEHEVEIRFSDGFVYPERGLINFLDVSVDRGTDTITVRADLPNPKGLLTDGQLVRVDVRTGAPQERVLVPQSALIADQGGVYVFVVDNGKAVTRRLKLGGSEGQNAIVASGLDGGELVVVEGMQTLRPGAPVVARPQTIPQAGG